MCKGVTQRLEKIESDIRDLFHEEKNWNEKGVKDIKTIKNVGCVKRVKDIIFRYIVGGLVLPL